MTGRETCDLFSLTQMQEENVELVKKGQITTSYSSYS